jgi:hypothetical protein
MGQLSDLHWMMAFSSRGLYLFMFPDLSSPLIYPPGLLRWSECQVLVDVGREHVNMIFFAYKFHISENSLRISPKPFRTNQMTPGNLLSHLQMCYCQTHHLSMCHA